MVTYNTFQLRRTLPSLIFMGVSLAVWWIVTELGIVSPIVLPGPIALIDAVPEVLDEGLLSDIGQTLRRVGFALFAACVVGIPLGLFFGYRGDIYRVFEQPLHALRSVPATALFPLLLIVVGVGEASIITLAGYPSLLVILVNVVAGARLANRRRLYQAKELGLGAWATVRDVVLYEALPGVFDGVRTAVSYALVLVVAVEMFIGVGEGGLGRAIYDYQATYRIPETYVTVAVAGLIGIILNAAVTATERYALRWLPHSS